MSWVFAWDVLHLLRKNGGEHLTHFVFPIRIKKWQWVIASWNKWQFCNLSQQLEEKTHTTALNTFTAWRKGKKLLQADRYSTVHSESSHCSYTSKHQNCFDRQCFLGTDCNISPLIEITSTSIGTSQNRYQSSRAVYDVKRFNIGCKRVALLLRKNLQPICR